MRSGITRARSMASLRGPAPASTLRRFDALPSHRDDIENSTQSMAHHSTDPAPPLCLVRGSINIDEFFHVPAIVRPGETRASTAYARRGGGKGANQAAAVARAGGRVTLVGAVGRDGAPVLRDLRDAGVDTAGVVVSDTEPTGRAIIQLTPAGENCILLYAGANALTAPASLSAPPPALAYTHLLLQNEVPWPATLSYLAHAAAIGATAVLNPSPLPSNAQLRALPWDRVAWLVVNAGEARGVLRALAADAAGALGAAGAAGASGAGDEEGEGKEEEEAERDDGEVSVDAARALLRALHASPAFARAVGVVCTLGAQGVLALLPPPPPPSPVSSSPSPVASLSAAADSTSSASFRAAAAAAEDPTESAAPEPKQEPEPDIVYLPAATLDGPVRDTTGAGDCFAGYFVAGLMEASVSASASSASASAAAASSASSAAAADASSTHSATHAAAAASAANTQPNTAADAREATVLALRRAVEAAGLCVQRPGAAASVPARAEVERRLRAQ